MRAFVVDAFTSIAFRGNPAGVVFLDEDRPDDWLQALAAELKHSETAYVTARSDGDHDLRWFTPNSEVDLCGHATVATAHALHESGVAGPFTFHTRSGVLHAAVSDAGVTLDFPAATLTPTDTRGLADAVAADVLAVHRASTGDLLAEVTDESVVAGLQPDIAAVARLDARGLIVTARADAGRDYDVVSRFFAPREGIPEDPVTGSAHCALAPYWTPRLGTSQFVGAQLSPRGGRIEVELAGDRVRLRGGAVTVLSGRLHI